MFRIVRLKHLAWAAALMVLAALVGWRVIDAHRAEDAMGEYSALRVVPSVAVEPPREKTIYLTFDDGPSPNTVRLLDILKEKGVPATFFVTGWDSANAPELFRRMMDEGHTVGVHTYSHKYQEIYASREAFLEDFQKISDLITQSTGAQPTISRFPGGSANSQMPKWLASQLTAELTRRGYTYFDWNVVSGDQTATVYPAQTLLENVITGSKGKDRLVVLFHDAPLCKTSPDAAALVIDHFQGQGWTFAAITPATAPIQFTKPPVETGNGEGG